MDVVTLGQARADAAKRYGTFIRPRGDFVMLGDSLTSNTGKYRESDQFYEDSLPYHIAAQSGGALRLIRNAGVSGNTTAQMLARFDTDVTPYKPGTVIILGGTNDLYATPFPLATTAANIKAIVAKVRSIGAVPVLATVPPFEYRGTGGKSDAIALNTWIRRYAQTQGLVCLDVYREIVDPATGNMKAAYSQGDAVHFNTAAQVFLGGRLAPALTGQAAASATPLVSYDNSDTNNLLADPLFIGTPSAGIAQWWSNYGNANANGYTASITTDANVPGSMQTVTGASATGNGNVGQNIAGSKLVAGHRLAMSGWMTTTGTPGYAQVKLGINGSTAKSVTIRTTQVVTRELFYAEIDVPAGATSADVFITLGAGSGSISVGQFTVYDLTALGLA